MYRVFDSHASKAKSARSTIKLCKITPVIAFLLFISTFCLSVKAPGQLPEQVHIATTGNPAEMVVTWVTADATPTSTVQYGLSSESYGYSTTGSTHTYTDGGWVGIIHDVVLTGLTTDTRYFYRVGDSTSGWSGEFDFMSPPDYQKNISFAAYADHGQSSEAQDTNANIAADSLIDLIVHPGDLSYANGYQPEWDIWFNQIEENAARMPYMIVAGNHETYYDIPATLARFNNPYLQSGSDSEFYYSFNYSMIHFVAVCSDVDFFVGSAQYNWLEKDLAAADSDRAVHPWIIAFSHRPMYSSNDEHGSDLDFRNDIEPLLDQYGVDLAIWAHDHAYERTYPVYQETPSDTDPRLYISPADTIHMVAGMGGGGLYTTWVDPKPSWSAYREAVWGYVRVSVDTDGNLHSEFIRNVDHKVRDEFWIVKEGVIPDMPPLTEELTVLPRGAIWRYSEVHPQPNSNWIQPGFNDSGWLSGPAPFGFGDSTTYGTVLNDNDGSYYFRKTFNVESVDDYESLTLYVASDNYAKVYLNGVLVDDDTGSDHEFAYWNRAVDIPPSSLQVGSNTIAVSVYNNAGSSDAYFDLELTGEIIVSGEPNQPPAITSGDITCAIEGLPYSNTYTASDPENDALTWSLITDASWLSINPSSGILSGTPSLANVGTYQVNVTVSDSHGAWDSSRFDLTVSLAVPLSPGWNLVSIPLEIQNMPMEDLLQSIEGKYDSVETYDATEPVLPWKIYHSSKPTHMNDQISIGKYIGFWLHITDPTGATLTISRTKLSGMQDITLNKGWNLVGFPSIVPRVVSDITSNLAEPIHIMGINSSQGYPHFDMMSADSLLKPKNGYWIYSPVAQVWSMNPQGGNENFSALRISIPAYFYPGSLWDQAIADAPATAIMIMNPSNGPGSSSNPNYVSTVADAQAAGIKVLGYIYTLYGARDTAAVKSEIDKYMNWYFVDGIFLDEVSNDPPELPYYQELADYIRSKPGSFIMINPGTVTDEGYMNAADVVTVFESDYASYVSRTFPSWMDGYAPTRFCHLVFETPAADFENAWFIAMNHTVGYVYITDDVLDNPWDSLPSYWSSEVQASNSA